jgi:hypothetical protein
MDIKEKLTKTFLEKANTIADDKTLKKYMQIIWKNTRLKGNRSMGLTHAGFLFLKNKVNLKFYEIKLTEDLVLTNQLVIWLDQHLDCPHYLGKNAIFVTKERVAVQLILFDGNLYKFGKSKELAKSKG